jgi:hypothetical protein
MVYSVTVLPLAVSRFLKIRIRIQSNRTELRTPPHRSPPRVAPPHDQTLTEPVGHRHGDVVHGCLRAPGRSGGADAAVSGVLLLGPHMRPPRRGTPASAMAPPAPRAVYRLFRWGAAEQMRLQVEAYSKSIACALIDAGHCLRRGSFCTALLEKGPPSVRCRRTRRCGSRWCPTSSPWSASSSPPATAPRVARPVPCRRGHYRR